MPPASNVPDQDFSPVKSICSHLNAFHAYADDPKRMVEANHYCAHITDGTFSPSTKPNQADPPELNFLPPLVLDVRQCILYDGPGPSARLIGIEYMITPKLYEGLSPEERKLWHSHVFEVKSGMLIMPQPSPLVPNAVWEKAENKEMEQVVTLYGKVYHLWQVDRGDKLPLGEPRLMTSFTDWDQIDVKQMEERDRRFGSDWRRKREVREYIETPEIHPDADQAWKKKEGSKA
jgi:hypothetical protein